LGLPKGKKRRRTPGRHLNDFDTGGRKTPCTQNKSSERAKKNPVPPPLEHRGRNYWRVSTNSWTPRSKKKGGGRRRENNAARSRPFWVINRSKEGKGFQGGQLPRYTAQSVTGGDIPKYQRGNNVAIPDYKRRREQRVEGKD